MASISEGVALRPHELQEYLTWVFAHPEAHYVPCIVGKPGTGKSDIVNGSIDDAGSDRVLMHPVTADPTDFKGMPATFGEIAKFLPFDDLLRLIEASTPTICFIDDAGQAPASVQAALMQLVLARQIGEHKISEHVQFVMATNSKDDKAGVAGMLEPLKGRCQMVRLETSKDDLCKWMYRNGMPAELIAFINLRSDFLDSYKPTAKMVNGPTPRTIAAVGQHINDDVPPGLEYAAFSACAGEAFAAEFVGFLKIFRKIPNPQEILLHPDTARLPERGGMATHYAICCALARMATESNFPRIVTYADRMADEFHIMLVNDAVTRCPDICGTRAFQEWGIVHGELLS